MGTGPLWEKLLLEAVWEAHNDWLTRSAFALLIEAVGFRSQRLMGQSCSMHTNAIEMTKFFIAFFSSRLWLLEGKQGDENFFSSCCIFLLSLVTYVHANFRPRHLCTLKSFCAENVLRIKRSQKRKTLKWSMMRLAHAPRNRTGNKTTTRMQHCMRSQKESKLFHQDNWVCEGRGLDCLPCASLWQYVVVDLECVSQA